jgi:predicted nucleotidyltransferase
MKTTFDHLPEQQQREIRAIVDLLREAFKRVFSRRTTQNKRSGCIFKIILFGSYAKGGVADPAHGYVSDYDVLVIVSNEKIVAECFLSCTLLVTTNCRHKTHNLKRLLMLCEQQELGFGSLFPREKKYHRRCFELLKQAMCKPGTRSITRLPKRSWSGWGSRCWNCSH